MGNDIDHGLDYLYPWRISSKARPGRANSGAFQWRRQLCLDELLRVMSIVSFGSIRLQTHCPLVVHIYIRRKKKTSASFVSSSLTNRVSLLSLSDKSTVDVVGNMDMDYATGSFCSSCSIPPPTAGGLWCLKGVRGGTLWTGKPQARNPTHKRKAERPLNQRRHWCAGVGCAMCSYDHD